MYSLNQALKLKASTMDSQQVIPMHLKQWMQSYIHALILVTLSGLIYDLNAPEQLVSLAEQLVIATEQLRKCFGAVSKCSGAVSQSYEAVTKVFQSS